MDTEVSRFGGAAMAVTEPGSEPLDYYFVFRAAGDRMPVPRLDGIVVEEFVLAGDYSAVGLNTAAWTSDGGTWWSSSALGRDMRGHPNLRSRVVPVGRADAARVYREFDAGDLPDEATLRTHFRDCESLTGGAPLRLDSGRVPDGFQDRRVYRILFAKELSGERLANLQVLWQMTPTGDIADPRTRVVATAHRYVSGDVFRWDLRRIGNNVAWCLDVTIHLAGGPVDTVGPLLRELRTVMRQQGLIPVTIERFS